jgi:hypothetical protein
LFPAPCGIHVRFARFFVYEENLFVGLNLFRTYELVIAFSGLELQTLLAVLEKKGNEKLEGMSEKQIRDRIARLKKEALDDE